MNNFRQLHKPVSRVLIPVYLLMLVGLSHDIIQYQFDKLQSNASKAHHGAHHNTANAHQAHHSGSHHDSIACIWFCTVGIGIGVPGFVLEPDHSRTIHVQIYYPAPLLGHIISNQEPIRAPPRFFS